MSATEIRTLATRAGISRDASVLDLCCGVGGPGRMLVAEHGCTYLGVDYSASALEIAREAAQGLPCRFVQTHLPPVPVGSYDVVLLLETMLAFADKAALIGEVSRVLAPHGRFALTVETGAPLTTGEQALMPDADTVHLIALDDLEVLLARAGLVVTWREQVTAQHAQVAAALLESFSARSADIVDHLGRRARDDLVAAHQLWCEWFAAGRVEKVALVAEKG